MPFGVVACASHNSRVDVRCPVGWNTVPTSAPSSARPTFAADVTSVGMPALVAIVAACTLVAMPPRPTPAPPAPPTRAWAMSCASRTSVIKVAPGLFGGASYSPSTSDSRISALAFTTWATKAASRSLSPKRISSVATVSFSLTTGITPSSSRRKSVRCALR